MQVDFHRNYIKQWVKLSLAKQRRASKAIELFVNDPRNPKLRLHQLKGKYYPQFSISAGGDLRLHFLMSRPGVIVFVAIGTHTQLYE